MPRSRRTARKVSAVNQRRPPATGTTPRGARPCASACAASAGRRGSRCPRSPSHLGISYSRIVAPAEHLPRELAEEPVVLVGVVAARARARGRARARRGAAMRLLRRRAEVRQVAVAEAAETSTRELAPTPARSRAALAARLGGRAASGAGEHEPRDARRRAARRRAGAIVPPAPISMSSACAPSDEDARPRDRAGRPSRLGEGAHRAVHRRRRRPRWRPPRAQGGRPLPAERLEVARRRAACPSAPRTRHTASACSRPRRSSRRERLLDELVAGLDVVEDLARSMK